MSSEHKQKISDALKGKKKTESHKLALKNHKRTEEHNNNLTMMVNYGVTHASKVEEKNYFSEKYWIAKGSSPEEAKLILSNMQKDHSKLVKKRTSLWTTSYWMDKGFTLEESKIKISEIQTQNAKKSIFTISKSETFFLDNLEKALNINIERNVLLIGKFLVDGFILEKNIVIEYFGDFWHMNPNIYNSDYINRVTKRKASAQWAEDNGRIECLCKAGYETYVVWESDSQKEIIQKILKEIN